MKRILFSLLVASAGSLQAFPIDIVNKTGHDINTVTIYNNGKIVNGEQCIPPNGVKTQLDLPVNISKNGKLSAEFIARYSSDNGTCRMNSTRVSYSNIISFDPEDFNKNMPTVHYFVFTSTGLNMTPAVVFNPSRKVLTTYTGYRQGDKDPKAYAFYLKNDSNYNQDGKDNRYNSKVYISRNQELDLF
ncbi:hypothetical protein OAO18_03855 [Francisellaceae bacterium]|nr:hypothetical protein [Francisellaceae bacterium]